MSGVTSMYFITVFVPPIPLTKPRRATKARMIKTPLIALLKFTLPGLELLSFFCLIGFSFLIGFGFEAFFTFTLNELKRSLKVFLFAFGFCFEAFRFLTLKVCFSFTVKPSKAFLREKDFFCFAFLGRSRFFCID